MIDVSEFDEKMVLEYSDDDSLFNAEWDAEDRELEPGSRASLADQIFVICRRAVLGLAVELYVREVAAQWERKPPQNAN